MKQSVFYILLISVFFSLVLSPSCSTTEEAPLVYDITGFWTFTCVWDFGLSETLIFSFTGAVTNGVASDLTNGYSGIYTVNNTVVEIITNHISPICGNIADTFSGVFTSPTSMAGSHMRAHSGPCWIAGSMTWTATKL